MRACVCTDSHKIERTVTLAIKIDGNIKKQTHVFDSTDTIYILLIYCSKSFVKKFLNKISNLFIFNKKM